MVATFQQPVDPAPGVSVAEMLGTQRLDDIARQSQQRTCAEVHSICVALYQLLADTPYTETPQAEHDLPYVTLSHNDHQFHLLANEGGSPTGPMALSLPSALSCTDIVFFPRRPPELSLHALVDDTYEHCSTLALRPHDDEKFIAHLKRQLLSSTLPTDDDGGVFKIPWTPRLPAPGRWSPVDVSPTPEPANLTN